MTQRTTRMLVVVGSARRRAVTAASFGPFGRRLLSRLRSQVDVGTPCERRERAREHVLAAVRKEDGMARGEDGERAPANMYVSPTADTPTSAVANARCPKVISRSAADIVEASRGVHVAHGTAPAKWGRPEQL